MEQNNRWQEIGQKILIASRNELYLNLPFLDAALCSLPLDTAQNTEYLATDGKKLYYNGSYLAFQYEKARSLVCRAYLHTLLHCMLRHPFKKGERDGELWNLACDIAVESILDALPYPCLAPSTLHARRNHWYATLQQEMKVLTAESIYRHFRRHPLEEMDMATLSREFFADDHHLWNKAHNEEQEQEISSQWQQISERIQTQMETVMSEAGSDGEAVLEQLRVETQETTNYRGFLRRFAVLGEEMTVDADSFDYSYYVYGLQQYGNMPLIEPLETKESKRIEDFVIAIDTSMSTSGELVRSFLSYTYALLKDSESFFKRINLRIIQCDDQIRADQKITNAQELADYMQDFQLIGQSATDFRPVFAHVQNLIDQGAFRHLRGLLYFTDGLGIYPAKRPPYEAAFVMLSGQGNPERVPPWGIRLLVSEDEIIQQGETFQ